MKEPAVIYIYIYIILFLFLKYIYLFLGDNFSSFLKIKLLHPNWFFFQPSQISEYIPRLITNGYL